MLNRVNALLAVRGHELLIHDVIDLPGEPFSGTFTGDDIRAAAERVKGSVVRTPMMKSDTLSEIVDAEVWLKFENLQFTAAYKERGALNKLLQLTDEERSRGVIAASAGNHAQAVAYHGRRLGVPVTIVMPVSTPMIKVTQTEGHGAHVVLHGERVDDAFTKAREIEAERGLITARAARVNNRITYHVALGGGARTGGIDEDRELAP